MATEFESNFICNLIRNNLLDNFEQKNHNKKCSLHDLQLIKSFISKGNLVYFFDVLWFPVFLIAVYLLHWSLAVILIVGALWLGALAVGSHLITTRRLGGKHISAPTSQVTSREILANAEVIKSLGMISPLLRRWEKSHLETADQECNVSERLAVVAAVGKASCLLFQSLTLGLGAYLAINDALSAGGIVAASILVGRGLGPIEAVIMAWNRLLECKGAIFRLLSLIEIDLANQGEFELGNTSGRLVVHNLSFRNMHQPVFRNISFELERGSLISIAGPSGAGKSALAKHLVGLQQDVDGIVRFDGRDLRTMRDEMRLQRIGYMPQELDSLSGSIVDYIGRFGSFHAEDVLHAACISGAHDMIMNLPDQYATRLGNGGTYLSAGQRKLLSLARACCGIPELLILDDPCAYMDEEGDRCLQKAVAELRLHGTIVCLVTNKVAIIQQSELVIVLNARGESRIGRPNDIFSTRLHALPTRPRKILAT